MKDWLAAARHPRWKRSYTELVYQPMLEVMRLFRANGYKTYFVTGGGQDLLEVRHREFRHRLAVTGKHGPERLDVLEIRLRLRQHRHPFEAVDHLRVHGLLDPRGAVPDRT